VQDLSTDLRRQADPRESITGRLLVVGVALATLTFVAVVSGIWLVTTRLAATQAQADIAYRGGLLLLGTLVVGQACDTFAEGYEHVHTFEAPGDYEYCCAPHQTLGLEGSFTVR